jgi:hypothetical protein
MWRQRVTGPPVRVTLMAPRPRMQRLLRSRRFSSGLTNPASTTRVASFFRHVSETTWRRES